MSKFQKTAAVSAAVLALTGTAAALPAAPFPAAITAYAEEANRVTVDDVEYTLYEDHAAVYDYLGRNRSEITIPDTVEGLPVTAVEENAFNGTSLKKVILPESVAVIGKGAFASNYSLESVTCPGVKEIGMMAFYVCEVLQSVTLPEGLTTIGYSAFSGCKALTEIKAPSTLTEIGAQAFRGTGWLEALHTEGVPVVLNHIVIDGTKCKGTVTLSTDVTTIGADAFADNAELTEIKIPGSVTEIRAGAFSGCTGLKNLALPDSVTEIPDSMCSGCTALEGITFSDKLTKIGEYAFMKTALREIQLPEGVTVIADHTFEECKALKTFQYWKLEKIGKSAFRDCTSLYFFVNGEIEEIDNNAFQGCTSLETILFPLALKKIGNQSFRGCTKLRKVTIMYHLRSIDNGAFMECTALEQADIKEPFAELDDQAFSDCPKLVLRGYDGSTTEEYATAHNLQFESLGAIQKSDETRGDVTDDGEVSIDDVQTALKAYTERVAGKDPGLTKRQLWNADVDYNGKLELEDVQYTLKYYTVNIVALKKTSWNAILSNK